MKKFYFLMLAMIVSFAANAWTVKFTNPQNWAQVAVWAWDGSDNFTGGVWPGKLMTKEGDVWTYTGEGAPTKIIFNNNNNGSQTGDLNFVDGATYDMNGVVGAVITYGKVYIPYSNYQYEVAYLHTWDPSITGGWPGLQMSKVTENGIDFWMAEINNDFLPATCNWLLNGGGDENKTGDLPKAEFKDGYVTTIAGVSTPLADYTESGDNPVVKTYTLRGQIFGVEEWADYDMVESNGKWSYTGNAIPGQFGISERIASVQTSWFASASAATAVINAPGTFACSNTDITNFTSNLTGEVTFTFDPATLTLEVTGGEVVPVDYTSWYLNVVGDFNEWTFNGVTFDAEGKATATNVNIGANPFKIKVWNGTADLWYSTGGEIAQDTPVTVVGNNEAGMIIAGAVDADCFDVTFDVANGVLTVVNSASSGIASIAVDSNAAVEYFNLQGVRVENPSAGLYIRRQGSNVTKVMVK